MKHLSLATLVCLIGFSLLTSCRERLNIDTSAAAERLVIFGRISADSACHSVQITRSIPYFSTDTPPAVSGAWVEISDETESYLLREVDSLPGIYLTDSTVCGLQGTTYTLNVRLDFDGDGVVEHYRASSTMPQAPKIDSVALSPLVYNMTPLVVIYGAMPTDQHNFFCLYTGKNNQPKSLFEYYMLIDDWYVDPSQNAFILPCFIPGGLEIGDTINFRVDALNAAYNAFLSQAKSEMGASLPFFSAPPAEVVSNITCLDADIQVSGFFAAFVRGEDFIMISDKNLSY
ncbi:MAG: DUF4249 domain-containing protein [Prevotellaceae bacterium]|nr:DUF4249 domain-containing protein [Prevotellaceae bacterium]